jgi:aryl-alcohol dehydrogenase-like predicted oxidoreductase
MNYHLLQKSDLRISEISLGCMSLGTDEATVQQLINAALDKGINYFDTADLYDKGVNEVLVGKALKPHRSEIILASKVGNKWRADGSGWDWVPTKQYILTEVENSLRRLGTDYLDLYQLHGGTLDDPIDDIIEAFEQLQQQGKIRYYGTSSIRPNVIREYVKRSNIVSVMMQYSLLDRRPEESCLDLLQQHHIGVLARGSVAQGLLINKPAKPYLNYSAGQVQQAADAVRSLTTPQRNATQTALRYVLQQPAITSAVVGIRTEAQLNDVLQTLQSPALTDEEIKKLQGAIPQNYYEQHR